MRTSKVHVPLPFSSFWKRIRTRGGGFATTGSGAGLAETEGLAVAAPDGETRVEGFEGVASELAVGAAEVEPVLGGVEVATAKAEIDASVCSTNSGEKADNSEWEAGEVVEAVLSAGEALGAANEL